MCVCVCVTLQMEQKLMKLVFRPLSIVDIQLEANMERRPEINRQYLMEV